MTATNGRPPVMPLVELLTVWRPGSRDAPWDWSDERRDLAKDPAMPELRASIAADGIRRPVLLGNDGRVWDGHHRICAALELGLDRIPIELAEPTPSPTPPAAGQPNHPALAAATVDELDRLQATIRRLRAALDVAAAHVLPGPDSADDEIREDLIRAWLGEGAEDAASWAQECTRLALRLIVTQRAARRLLTALGEALPDGPGPGSDIRGQLADDRAALDALISAPTGFSRPLTAGLAAEQHVAERVIDRFVPSAHNAAARAFVAELGER